MHETTHTLKMNRIILYLLWNLALIEPLGAACYQHAVPCSAQVMKAPISPSTHGISIVNKDGIWQIKNLHDGKVFIHFQMLRLSANVGLEKVERFRFLEPGESFQFKVRPNADQHIIGVDLLERTKLKRDPITGVYEADR